MGVLDFVNLGLKAGTEILNQVNQKKAWAREDNAVQRRVADLKAAGLSPILAAGSAASSSAPIRINAPEYTENVRQQNAGIAQTKAETDLRKEQKHGIISDNAIKMYNAFQAASMHDILTKEPELAREYFLSRLNRELYENEEVMRNYEIYRHYKVPSMGTAGDDIIVGQQMLQNLFPDLNTEKGSGMSVLMRTLVPLLSMLGRKK